MILSFSPEKFLTRDGNMLTSSPIKGTLKRHENSQIDAQNIDVFQADIKNCAENTMIVDLTRNDFNKICNTGTVKVPSLCRLMSLPNVHHLVSDIQGDLPKNTRFSDIFTAIFPPPSMTGAPKILATQTAIKLEGIKRGFYSGAMGILSHNYFDFSVIIRTLILQNNRFEFQSGGGITYLSNPHEEVAEMYNKINFLKSIINI
jgi:anthranilate/para-aminobenzoate synthase component I